VDVQNSASSHDAECTELFPFYFCFYNEPWDEIRDPHQLSQAVPQTLPSTIDITSSNGSWCSHARRKAYGAEPAKCNTSTRVKYEIQALAYQDGEVVASVKLEVRIHDTVDYCPPPIHVDHFPAEYVIYQGKRLRKILALGGRRLTIAAAEPRPLHVKQDVKVHLVAVPVRFALRKDPKRPHSYPAPLSVKITSLLSAKTFISIREMQYHPTVQHVKLSPYLAMVPRYGQTFNRKLKICEWKSLQIGEEGSKESAWTCDTFLWLPACEQSSLTPTFFTPYLSKRYSLSLRVDAKSSDGKALFHLNMPLQIVYPTDIGGCETAMAPQHSESADGDEEDFVRMVDRLPLYVR
jgi:hypothetical protein